MKKNVGSIDKVIRFLVAALIAVLFFTKVITGTIGIILLVFAGILVLTALMGFCGLYSLFGISTCKVQEKK
ncbi:MAG TPA: DUF2892 domain-containing protein [Bacteroidales bacterium]|nr:DUF2892 domain-containing protein [Bacteroidales bacterium]HRR92859.1 DUF2892 domain-containing protein [Bacteroidales bacterium]HRT89426.1 DUF2892 domain-containing protein [Bacteroidales bacterium]